MSGQVARIDVVPCIEGYLNAQAPAGVTCVVEGRTPAGQLRVSAAFRGERFVALDIPFGTQEHILQEAAGVVAAKFAERHGGQEA